MAKTKSPSFNFGHNAKPKAGAKKSGKKGGGGKGNKQNAWRRYTSGGAPF